MLDLSAEEPIKHLCFDSSQVSRNMFATIVNQDNELQYMTATVLAVVVEKVKSECTCSLLSRYSSRYIFSCSLEIHVGFLCLRCSSSTKLQYMLAGVLQCFIFATQQGLQNFGFHLLALETTSMCYILRDL